MRNNAAIDARRVASRRSRGGAGESAQQGEEARHRHLTVRPPSRSDVAGALSRGFSQGHESPLRVSRDAGLSWSQEGAMYRWNGRQIVNRKNEAKTPAQKKDGGPRESLRRSEFSRRGDGGGAAPLADNAVKLF